MMENSQKITFMFDDANCKEVSKIISNSDNKNAELCTIYKMTTGYKYPWTDITGFLHCNSVKVCYDGESFLKQVYFGQHIPEVILSGDVVPAKFIPHYKVVWQNLIYATDGSCKLIGIEINENIKNWNERDAIDFSKNDLKLKKKILS